VSIQQVAGDHNIFTNTGDVHVHIAPPPAPFATREQENARVLLSRVKHVWIDGFLRQALADEPLISLAKQLDPQAVQHRWDRILALPNQEAQQIHTDTHIAQIFDRVGRLLLILGEPGSGKTTTLLELATDLVTRAEANPGQPVPVVLNLSTWDRCGTDMTSRAKWCRTC
jgi:predicted NACHT family NTPase